MHIKIYAIAAALFLASAAVWGWSIMGPDMFMGMLTTAMMCF
jgi:hypothetical protein